MTKPITPPSERNRFEARSGTSSRLGQFSGTGVTPLPKRADRVPAKMFPEVKLLWVDLTVAVHKSELPREIERRAEVSRFPRGEDLLARCRSGEIDVVCFDFDYPDRNSLRLLQDLKRNVPKVPILMLTLQHSECLAIWAFRSRVWDYLVKPIPASEIARCFDGLYAAINARKRQSERTVSMHMPPVPEEASSRVPSSSETILRPALNFLETHYKSKILLDDVAPLCNLNRFQFSRRFKETYHVGFSQYVFQYRLGIAMQLLKKPGVSVTEVCYSVGFNDTSYFTKAFHNFYGVLPSSVSRSTNSLVEFPFDQLPEPLGG